MKSLVWDYFYFFSLNYLHSDHFGLLNEMGSVLSNFCFLSLSLFFAYLQSSRGDASS